MDRKEGVLCIGGNKLLCVGGKEFYVYEGRSAMCRREGMLCVGGEGRSAMCRRGRRGKKEYYA